MGDAEPLLLTYEDAVRIRREVKLLEAQLGRIITDARANRSAAEMARDLQLTEGRVYQILREHRSDAAEK
ncbi:hypothetical protein AB8O64_19825 [Streptomyces sp. QH1-20]|uniref:hypothetical protein n=1 Tax=Streptomyces sp. QH1-20 TaxID=3240934 RepID=UPI003517FDFD